MARPKANRPTDRELDILQVLWTRGGSTVREVHAELSKAAPISYTGVLKLIQIMTDKRLVVRDESKRPQVYTAAISRDQAQQTFLTFLLDRLFAGSAGSLVMRALSGGKATRQEREELRKWLDEQNRN